MVEDRSAAAGWVSARAWSWLGVANMHLSRFPIWPAHYWQGIQRTAGCEMELQVFDGGVSTLLGDGDVLRAKGSYDPSPGLQPRGFTDAVT